MLEIQSNRVLIVRGFHHWLYRELETRKWIVAQQAFLKIVAQVVTNFLVSKEGLNQGEKYSSMEENEECKLILIINNVLTVFEVVEVLGMEADVVLDHSVSEKKHSHLTFRLCFSANA